MTHRMLQQSWALAMRVGLGLVVVVAVAAPWSALILCNLRLSPHLPWALPAGVAYVCLAVAYLNGGGWPQSTSAARKRYFRAELLVWRELNWALFAGVTAVTSLWLALAASGYLSAQPPQHSQIQLPPLVLFGTIIIGAAVTAIAEEGGLRGFMQAPLESLIGPAPAILTTSVFFVLIHLSHGTEALARFGLFYLAAGCVYGLLAYLTQSILPSLILHFLGDVFVFGLQSSLVHLTSPHSASIKMALILASVLMAFASGVAFIRLARLTASKRSHLGMNNAAI
jgi:membrane protease YdiL (CAAX protease family)